MARREATHRGRVNPTASSAIRWGQANSTASSAIRSQACIHSADLERSCRLSTGTVKKFFVDKGYGFITPDEGGEDVFVHRVIHGDGQDRAAFLEVGTAVTYEVKWDKRKGNYACSSCSGFKTGGVDVPVDVPVDLTRADPCGNEGAPEVLRELLERGLAEVRAEVASQWAAFEANQEQSLTSALRPLLYTFCEQLQARNKQFREECVDGLRSFSDRLGAMEALARARGFKL